MIVWLYSAIFLLTVLTAIWASLPNEQPENAQKPTCQEKHFKQMLDHFSFVNNVTFSQRYIICQEHWQDGGPIFFYTGNEGDIMSEVNNTGFMFELATEFHGMVVFAEHRYYGKSTPFNGVLNSTTLPWLTTSQALADYNDLILYLKKKIKGASSSAVVTVGGSYGGMLSAWMRMKYPSTILGALASSAPLLQFGTGGDLAMSNYAYPTNFLYPLPAWPVKVACQYLNDSSKLSSDQTLLHAVYQAISVYYNFTGDVKECYNVSEFTAGPDVGYSQWDYQTCTELFTSNCTDGQTDMFYSDPWDEAAFISSCRVKFAVQPDKDMVLREYGGTNLTPYSNIIFSNGQLDPWYGGGILKTNNKLLSIIWIEEGAHHADLRSSHSNDPASVIKARELEMEIIRHWIN